MNGVDSQYKGSRRRMLGVDPGGRCAGYYAGLRLLAHIHTTEVDPQCTCYREVACPLVQD
jgi:hypothetical protein